MSFPLTHKFQLCLLQKKKTKTRKNKNKLKTEFKKKRTRKNHYKWKQTFYNNSQKQNLPQFTKTRNAKFWKTQKYGNSRYIAKASGEPRNRIIADLFSEVFLQIPQKARHFYFQFMSERLWAGSYNLVLMVFPLRKGALINTAIEHIHYDSNFIWCSLHEMARELI